MVGYRFASQAQKNSLNSIVMTLHNLETFKSFSDCHRKNIFSACREER